MCFLVYSLLLVFELRGGEVSQHNHASGVCFSKRVTSRESVQGFGSSKPGMQAGGVVTNSSTALSSTSARARPMAVLAAGPTP